MEYITLNNGISMPMLGYGVFRIDEAECERCVSDALEVGYRLIDTAAAYENEAAVGRAIRNSGIPREELFITTKLKVNGPDPMTQEEFDKSMDKLGLDYVDLYLIHQPYGNTFGAWDAMEKICASGRAKSIGVSNFSNAMLADLLVNHAIDPAVNQIEISPINQKQADVAYMQSKGVAPMAWGPLSQGGKGNMFENPVLLALAEKYEKSVPQIALRWHTQRGVVAIPKSTNRERMIQNLNIFDFSLTEEEMRQIETVEVGNTDDLHGETWFVEMLCGKWRLNDYRNSRR